MAKTVVLTKEEFKKKYLQQLLNKQKHKEFELKAYYFDKKIKRGKF